MKRTKIPDQPTSTWLRAIIEQHGLTQGEAAALIHVHPTTLRKWISPPRAIENHRMHWAYARALVAELEDIKND